MSNAIHTPAVYSTYGKNLVLATEATSNTVTFIARTDEGHVFDKSRVINFLKDYTLVDYPVAKCASKFLQYAATDNQSVIQTLRRVIMETAAVVVVNQDGTLVGRFADAQTAATASPETAHVCTQASDLEFLTKPQLITILGDKVPAGKISKDQLVTMAWEFYMGAEVTVPEPKAKRQKKEKAPKVDKGESFNAVIKRLLLTEFATIDPEQLTVEYAKSIATFRTQLGLIKAEGEKGTIISGHIAGKLVYFHKDHAPENLDPATEKATRTRATGEPRAPKTDGPVYKVHEYLNANPTVARKDAIAALVELGINKSTATTQYGAWKTARNFAAPITNA